MTAAKSGNHIYISGSGNTLASITSDIADITFIEKTSTAPDIYTVKGGVARYLRIRNGGTLTIGDPADYSKNETLAFSNNVANQLRFYVDAGGTLLQYGDTTIDFMTGTQRMYYAMLYGKIDVLGNDTYKPVWQNYHRLYFYEQQNNDTYSNDIWHFEKMIIGSACTANYYAFYFPASMGKFRSHIFKDILFDKSYGRGLTMYALRIVLDGWGIGKTIFENLDFHDVGNYPLYTNYGRVKLKNCTFGTTTSWKCYIAGTGYPDTSVAVSAYGYNDEHQFGQQCTFLEGATFENTGYIYVALIRQATVLFKDCEWQHSSGDSIQTYYQGKVMMWTGNTFTGGREYYDVDYGSMIQWVYDLNLTIKDKYGNNIEGATILIKQSDGKEQFTFITKANGKVGNCHDIECALLTWKHQYGNSKTTNMELWSDASTNNYHEVTVFKAGYVPVVKTYVMDQARTDTIVLKEISNLKIEM